MTLKGQFALGDGYMSLSHPVFSASTIMRRLSNV